MEKPVGKRPFGRSESRCTESTCSQVLVL